MRITDILDAAMKISTAVSSPSVLIKPDRDVATGWSHDTCKSADNCVFLLYPNTALFPSFTSLFLLFMLHHHHSILPWQMKNNFRIREETQTSSSTFHNQPTELTLSPKQMQGIRATESMTTSEWTDEKHSMYLKSMEASFVNQLYDSKPMLASFSRKGTSSSHAKTSGQFKVLRGGCWQKISFERENPQMSRINECHNLTASPWIQHYRSSRKQPSVAAPSLQESVTSTSQVVNLGQRKGISSGSGQLHFYDSRACHQDMICNDTEMSDQNFIDEEVECEKEDNRSNVKRLKSLRTGAKGKDQIVPIGKFSTIEDVNMNCNSAAEN